MSEICQDFLAETPRSVAIRRRAWSIARQRASRPDAIDADASARTRGELLVSPSRPALWTLETTGGHRASWQKRRRV
jgi:hypothetical protein